MRIGTRNVEYTETTKSRKRKSRSEKKLLSEPRESRSYSCLGSFSTSSREEETRASFFSTFGFLLVIPPRRTDQKPLGRMASVVLTSALKIHGEEKGKNTENQKREPG